MPYITVLLPVYNGEKYLLDAMESILHQSFTDFEFLLIDDGSTDNSVQLATSFQDSRIRLLHNSRRLKLSGALNRGLKEAKGKYIARMDADDIALPQRLNRQVDYMEKNPGVGICGSAIEVFGERVKTRREIYPSTSEKIQAYALFDCPFCHPAVMLRKEFLIKHNLFYNGSYYPTEDYELWGRAINLFDTANISEVLLRYRIHENSMTGSDWDQMDNKAALVIRRQLENFGIKFIDEDLTLHRNIGRGRSFRLKSPSELIKAENWLKKLINENHNLKKYGESALTEIISLVWFRLCMNNTFHGIWVFKRYRSSNLIKKDTMKMKRMSFVLLSVFKNVFIMTNKK